MIENRKHRTDQEFVVWLINCRSTEDIHPPRTGWPELAEMNDCWMDCTTEELDEWLTRGLIMSSQVAARRVVVYYYILPSCFAISSWNSWTAAEFAYFVPLKRPSQADDLHVVWFIVTMQFHLLYSLQLLQHFCILLFPVPQRKNERILTLRDEMRLLGGYSPLRLLKGN